MADERDKRKIGERRPHAQRLKRIHPDTNPRHLEQLARQARALAGEDEDEQQEVSLQDIRSRISGLQKRHTQLRETLSKPEKLQGEKLLHEFDEARANDGGSDLADSAWTDALLEAVFEKAHSEIVHENGNSSNPGRILYHIGRKTIFILTGGRVGIQFDPTFSGEVQESYYCVLSTKPPTERIFVSKDNIPFFLPLRDLEKRDLSISAARFINTIDNHLQAFVARRGQILKLKELHGDKFGDFYTSLPYNLIEFSLEELGCKVEVNLAYDNLESEYPTRCVVMVWSLFPAPARRTTARRGTRSFLSSQVTSRRLQKAEEVLITQLLPEAYGEFVKEIQAACATPSDTS